MENHEFFDEQQHVLAASMPDHRELRLFQEFSLFFRHFQLSKDCLDKGDFLDAHSHIVTALDRLARISVIENGDVPETAVWKQARKINPGIFKVYEELTMNFETLEQRLRLAHLACDFTVMSKLNAYCRPLLRIISSRPEPWSAYELENHPELRSVRPELQFMLKKLVRRSLIHEVLVPSESGMEVLELKYTG